MAWCWGWLAFRVAAGAWLLWRIPAPPGGADRPAASVVIPARDEAALLPATLAAVGGQLRAGDELVVVDDHSADGTAAAASAGGATVVAAPELPPGWTGKAWACATGARATTNPILVFLDADTTLDPGGLDRVVSTQADAGGMVSVQPFHRVPTATEQLSAYFNVVAVMGVDAFTPLGQRRQPSGAFGPVLAVGRADYDALGGHGAVAGEVLDDVALARSWRQAGRPVRAYGGRGVATFRMYPGGLGHLVEGWTKNFASGARSTRPLTALLVALWLSVGIQALVELTAGRWVEAGVLYLAAALMLGWPLRRVGDFHPLTVVLFPVPLVMFMAVFARSVFLTLFRRRVRWKGRVIGTAARGSSGARPRSP